MAKKRSIGNGSGRSNGKANGASNGRSNGQSNGKSNGRVQGHGRSGDRMRRQHRGAGGRAAARQGGGTLIIIGGREDKDGDRIILTEVARRVGSGKLVVATVASEVQKELFEDYDAVFRALGVKHVFKLEIADREEAFSERAVRVLDDATAVFFTGGDQLKITSQLGDSPVYDCILDIYEAGGLVVGTSAGASVMSETMMVSGNGSESHRIGGKLHMAPGLGLVQDIVIDQHFAERGRIGRLLGAVAQNPRVLGVGIDEDTAIIVDRGRRFEVIGDGAVYVVDASGVTYSNLTEEETDRALSLFGVQLHVLSMGDVYDIGLREPTSHPAEEVLERIGVED